MYLYDYKAMPPGFATIAAPGEVPSVAEVHPSIDGTGLEVSGWFATWDTDSAKEAFLPHAFDKALATALAIGLPVLYAHNKSEVPIGFVKTCVVKPGGLWGSIVLPAPLAGTKASEIYAAVKGRLIPLAFSVGGFWTRLNVGGKVKLMCDRLCEVSLAGVVTNQHATTTAVSSIAVKAITTGLDEYVTVAKRAADLEWLRGELRARNRRHTSGIVALQCEVADMFAV